MATRATISSASSPCEATDKGIIDLVWQVKSNNRLTLIVDQNNVGVKYLGAKLERLAAP